MLYQSLLARIAVVYGVTFFFILPPLCRNLPYSQYFIPGKDLVQRVVQKNEDRIALAKKYLDSLDQDGPPKLDPGRTKLRMAIGVISVDRQTRSVSTQYLTQVMARLHEAVTRQGVADEVAMFICNVQRAGQDHPEAERLARHFRVRRMPWKRQLSEGRKYEREKENYVFCLESAAEYKAEYVLMLQDDALPHENFYKVLDHLLRNRLERMTGGAAGGAVGVAAGGAGDWAWLKLNFPDELANYHRSPFFAYEWVALSLLLAGLAALVYHGACVGRVLPSTAPGADGKLPWRRHHTTLNVIFVASFLYTMLASWLIGRPYFLRLYGLTKYFARLTPGTSCCLPATLFPEGQVQGVVQYLGGVRCRSGFPLDFALDAYREQSRLRQYLAVPNLFSHIGYYSALHSGTSSTSAFAYLDC